MLFLTAHRSRRSACRACVCSGTFWSLEKPRCWPDVGSAHRSLPGTTLACCSPHTNSSVCTPHGCDWNSAKPDTQDEGWYITNLSAQCLFSVCMCIHVLHLPRCRSEVDCASPTGQSALHPQQATLLIPWFLTGT